MQKIICIFAYITNKRVLSKNIWKTIDDGMPFGYVDIDKEYIKIASSREKLFRIFNIIKHVFNLLRFLKLSYCKLLEPIISSW